MKKTVFLLIPFLIIFYSAIPGTDPCSGTNFFRVNLDDLPGIRYCISDSFKLLTKQVERDTFVEQGKGQFVYFDIFSTESNTGQIFYAILKDKANGKSFQTHLTCDNSSTSFSGMIQLKKLHRRKILASDYSVSILKIINGGKDTLKCDLGNLHINYLKK